MGFTGTPVEGVGVVFAQTNKQVIDVKVGGRLDAFAVVETSPLGLCKEQLFLINMLLMWGDLICIGSFTV